MSKNVIDPAVAELDGMSKDERSLLLYLESRAVDNAGRVEAEKMNDVDHEIAKQWANRGFIRFSRLLAKHVTPRSQFGVELSDTAWKAAGIERHRRGVRNQSKEVWESLAHFEDIGKRTQKDRSTP